MINHPKFSIAIPTYNRRATFLPQAIQGVLQQSYTDFELIISDNGSNDGTGEYVRSLDDARIRYIRHEQTLSAGEHFSTMLKKAIGEYVILHQDDDLLHKDFLDRADKAFIEHPDSVMYGTPIWRQEHGHGYHSRLMRPRNGHDDIAIICDNLIIFDGDYAAIQFFDPIRHFLHPTLAIRNSVLNNIGEFDSMPTYQTDLVTQARLLFQGTLIYDPRPGGVSRVHPENFMRTKDRKFRKIFFHNSYIELINAFQKACLPWQTLLEEYLLHLSEKEIIACLFEWTYYQAPIELQKFGFIALRNKSKSDLHYYRQCITKLGLRNLTRHLISILLQSSEKSWSINQ